MYSHPTLLRLISYNDNVDYCRYSRAKLIRLNLRFIYLLLFDKKIDYISSNIDFALTCRKCFYVDNFLMKI